MAKITDEFGNVIGEIKPDKGPGCLENVVGSVIVILILLIILNCCG